MAEQKKNQYIDVLKGISCIIVIFLHCPFPGIIGEGIIYGLRFSVPVFFMVSGYYSYAKSERWILEKAGYILKLLICTELFYGIWELIKQCVLEKQSMEYFVESAFKGKNVLQVILRGTVFNGTLWYLYAIFWTWLIVYVLRKWKVLDKADIIIWILLAVQIFGRAYVQNTYDIDKWVFLFRNALTFGVPFTLLGAWIARKYNVIEKKLNDKKIMCLLMLGGVLMIMEYFFIGQYMDTQVSTVIIAIGLFLYAISNQKPLKRYWNGVARIGGKWYTWIYLSHIFVMDVIDILYGVCNLQKNGLWGFVRPVLVCILACVCAEGMCRILNRKK